MQQFLESENKNYVEIYADEREQRNSEIIDELEGLGAKVNVKMLSVADFILSARCAAERKTRNDFEASIIDGRLFTQAQHLKENYERVIMVIEGKLNEERVRRGAVLGAYSSLMINYGISLFFTRDAKGTAEILFAIAKYEQLSKKQPLRLFAKRKALTIPEQQRAIIESLPGVGPKLARNMLEHFVSIENIISASEKELQEVDKMGKKKAKVIRNILKAVYSERK